MIYINIKDKTPPKELLDLANKLTEEIKLINDSEERKKFIDKNQYLWKSFKKWLQELSYNKCWYSEAKEIVSYYDVDHFRPKKRARQLDGTEREGYWWLAFDWRNFRISGQICNRPNKDENEDIRGKGDYFPVKNEKHIVSSPEEDVRDEIIYLLDPTDEFDPILLSFNEEGMPISTSQEGTWEYERVKVTIKYLHLDYPLLVDERKKIWNKCRRSINQAQNIMKKDNRSITENNELKSIVKELIDMISPEAELSSTARACLSDSSMPVAKSIVARF